MVWERELKCGHTVTMSRVGDRGKVVRCTTGSRDFLNSEVSRSALPFTQPCVQWAVRDLYPGIKQPERKVDDSPIGAEIRNAWGCILPSPLHVNSRCAQGQLLICVWNVMAHAQKPYFVFRRNGEVHLNRRGLQFSRLLAAELCASAVVMLDTPCSEVVWRVLAYPLHSPVSPSLPLPCVTVCRHISVGIYSP